MGETCYMGVFSLGSMNTLEKMNERVLNTHSKGKRVKIPLLPKQSKIKGAGQQQWSRQLGKLKTQLNLL